MKKRKPDFSLWCPVADNGSKLKHRNLNVNMRKYFSTVRMVDQWNRLSIELVLSPSVEALKTHLDLGLGNLR